MLICNTTTYRTLLVWYPKSKGRALQPVVVYLWIGHKSLSSINNINIYESNKIERKHCCPITSIHLARIVRDRTWRSQHFFDTWLLSRGIPYTKGWSSGLVIYKYWRHIIVSLLQVCCWNSLFVFLFDMLNGSTHGTFSLYSHDI